ncbi:sulfotransferase domain-containing protein [Candidatus Sumerlaeota bacterium]|nr:sulfotransferase domain-containing protein [Candidatus Sumerlaeota bacterium]
MASFLRQLLCKLRYGQPVIIVSGLPRSGTSMMMKMLEAGGLKPVTDGQRSADEDNPKGYYEFEQVKTLDKPGDKSWLGQYRGRVIKIISFLLKDLPLDLNYSVIFMKRNIEEILASQNKMLHRRGETGPEGVDDRKMAKNYEAHLRKTDYLMRTTPNFKTLYIDYKEALENPTETARRIGAFLGRELDLARMAETTDKQLYRNRK